MSYKILITGAAGFIGSNLVEYFLDKGYFVRALDNFSTGFEENIESFKGHPNFDFVEGDIQELSTCQNASAGIDFILHQAALGSVPRSIKDPLTTNSVNNTGFLNMLIAARDQNVKRFVYAASSSTYGDSKKLPKIEEEIGKPLSPYAITKYINELYANVFAKTYGMQCIGLRYFNVFGKRQTPEGAYAAVIPLWVKQLINHESPVINGDGSYSRDFTYIENVIQANEKAMLTPTEKILKRSRDYYNEELDNHKYFKEHPDSNNQFPERGTIHQDPVEGTLTEMQQTDKSKTNSQQPITNSQQPTANNQQPTAFSQIFNIAYGGNTNLLSLFNALKKELSLHDPMIAEIEPIFGPVRPGDIPHSQASIVKAQMILDYKPEFSAEEGFSKACEWYYNNLR
ncbi:MAG: NAD-dependent epimerase/dehydratase family protein [Brumimicrobium sp.]|nr:NAD-dependent epimerase/dehydratase family protein [Brumimicrobium sp.]